MDKYAVVEDMEVDVEVVDSPKTREVTDVTAVEAEKAAEATSTKRACPKCGSDILNPLTTNVMVCGRCGTLPFE